MWTFAQLVLWSSSTQKRAAPNKTFHLSLFCKIWKQQNCELSCQQSNESCFFLVIGKHDVCVHIFFVGWYLWRTIWMIWVSWNVMFVFVENCGKLSWGWLGFLERWFRSQLFMRRPQDPPLPRRRLCFVLSQTIISQNKVRVTKMWQSRVNINHKVCSSESKPGFL